MWVLAALWFTGHRKAVVNTAAVLFLAILAAATFYGPTGLILWLSGLGVGAGVGWFAHKLHT